MYERVRNQHAGGSVQQQVYVTLSCQCSVAAREVQWRGLYGVGTVGSRRWLREEVVVRSLEAVCSAAAALSSVTGPALLGQEWSHRISRILRVAREIGSGCSKSSRSVSSRANAASSVLDCTVFRWARVSSSDHGVHHDIRCKLGWETKTDDPIVQGGWVDPQGSASCLCLNVHIVVTLTLDMNNELCVACGCLYCVPVASVASAHNYWSPTEHEDIYQLWHQQSPVNTKTQSYKTTLNS